MEKNINQIVNDTQNGLDEIRSKVIGFLQDRNGAIGDELLLSLSEDGEFAETVKITPMGAIHHMYGLPTVNYHVVLIPEKYGNFKNLLDKPFEWLDFYNEKLKR